jgi:pimeloyl-ACP methyl ester carboxylesterase
MSLKRSQSHFGRSARWDDMRLRTARWIVMVICVLSGCRDAQPRPTERATPLAETDRTTGAPSAESRSAAAPSATADAVTQRPALLPATVQRIRVPGDVPASLVRGQQGGPPRIVFLPGLCSNANAYLHGFPKAANEHGGVVAIEGDRPCEGQPNFRTFTSNIEQQHGRIEAALAAAGMKEVPANGVTLVGYSLGASIAEKLAERWPERYARIILIGSPKDPVASRMRSTRAVATMSCERDVPPRMKDGARRLEAAGVPAKYFEMPGCTHGNLAEGDRVFGEAFSWLDANQRAAVKAGAASPIVGPIE